MLCTRQTSNPMVHCKSTVQSIQDIISDVDRVKKMISKVTGWVGGMARWLGALAGLSEDWGQSPSTHILAHNPL